MAARKKRAKPVPQSTAKLDAGWQSFISTALNKAGAQTSWPDPTPGKGSKARKTVVKRAKKKAK
ncbi:MAG: hypothetical protein JWN13_4203 [Betaproteobacteria bacterium]|jgi:hypothetical protein|nr:hypothetical protein [Betaproteobacteria bacterium]MEA3155319.1 hypothetical protein [Betaproteobacteria bacterium]